MSDEPNFWLFLDLKSQEIIIIDIVNQKKLYDFYVKCIIYSEDAKPKDLGGQTFNKHNRVY